MTAHRFLTHQGVEILAFDFTRTSSREETLERIAAARDEVTRHPLGSLLIVTDVTDSYVDAEVVRALGVLAADNKPYVIASAVVGAAGHRDGVRQLVAGMSRRSFQGFEELGAALDWLVEQRRTTVT